MSQKKASLCFASVYLNCFTSDLFLKPISELFLKQLLRISFYPFTH